MPNGAEITRMVYDNLMSECGAKAEVVEEQLAAVTAQIAVRLNRKK